MILTDRVKNEPAKSKSRSSSDYKHILSWPWLCYCDLTINLNQNNKKINYLCIKNWQNLAELLLLVSSKTFFTRKIDSSCRLIRSISRGSADRFRSFSLSLDWYALQRPQPIFSVIIIAYSPPSCAESIFLPAKQTYLLCNLSLFELSTVNKTLLYAECSTRPKINNMRKRIRSPQFHVPSAV